MSGPRNKETAPEDLLVFLANNTLEGVEYIEQTQAVVANPTAQTELRALQAIRQLMQSMDAGESPGAFGLARLMRDVEAAPHATVQRQTSNRWKYAAIAAMALLTVQISLPFLGPGFDAEMADGGNDEVVPAGSTLTVAFSAAATEREIRDLLLQLDLNIITGPSALGLYTLIARDAQAAQLAFDRLSKADDLIDSVEKGDGR